MLRWEDAGSTGVVLGGADVSACGAAPDFVRDCALPLVLCVGGRAAVRGTATLIAVPRGAVLLTASHLFEDGVRLGDLAAPAGETWVSLGAGKLWRDAEADVALVVLRRAECAVLERAWRAVPLAAVAGEDDRQEADCMHFVAGYPAALTRRHEDWLVAKRLLLLTGELAAAERPQPCAGRDLFLEYRRVAPRLDGTAIHTPELDGVSGAAVWGVRRARGHRRLMIVGVQSAFRHSRYLRAQRVSAAALRQAA